MVDAFSERACLVRCRQPFDGIIAAVNACGKPVLAIDIPSGLDCDTGRSLGATIRATHTVTFVAQKLGFANPARSSGWASPRRGHRRSRCGRKA